LDALRGLAALSVCFYHFVLCFEVANQYPWLNAVAALGERGVEVFFVISGFVLPLSMAMGGYRAGAFGRFLWKRVLRLYPPYLASIVVVLGIRWAAGLAPGYAGERFAVEPAVWLGHLTLSGDLLLTGWLTPVYWTLAIEFQFYLFVGLAFPLLVHRSPAVRTAGLAALLVAPYATAFVAPPGMWLRPFLTWWMAPFLLGIAAFQHRQGLLSTRALVGWTIVTGGTAAYSHGASSACATALATVVIAGVRLEWRPLLKLGDVSYSLYLTHMAVGGYVLTTWGAHATTVAARFALVAAALTASLAVAGGLYMLVEVPSQRWSGRVKYRRGGDDRRAAATPGVPTVPAEPPAAAAAVP
jgi:peptidoglycan/LPS O-acetylase OafA/YrhL